MKGIDWQFISNIMTTVIIPLIGIGTGVIGKRLQDSQKANQQFNRLTIEGFKAIGNLTLANTVAIKQDGKAGEAIERAEAEYRNFCKDIDSFLAHQATSTL